MFCRICLIENVNGQSIFQQYRGAALPEIVRTIAEIEIISGDGLPEHICYPCANTLLQAQDIRKRCIESDAVLHAKVLVDQHSEDSLRKLESEKNIFIWETVIQTYEPPCLEDNAQHLPLEHEQWNEPEVKEEQLSDSSDKDAIEPDNDGLFDDLEESYRCSECPKKFASKTRFQRHEKYHKQKKTKCPLCDHQFTHKSNLKRHIMTHKDGPLKCDQCKSVFSDCLEFFDHLKDHVKIEVQEEYIHECPVCGQRTKSVAAHRTHMKNVHEMEIEKPFKCKICTMCFTSKQGLNRHIDNIHDSNRKKLRKDEKSFLCTICGSKFSANFHLQVHIRTHTQEKPYKCSQCPKSFCQASGLKVHTITHTGEKPFACRICGKRFSQYGHVRSHLRIHSNEKPHTCKVCNRSFRVKGNLTAHMATHNGAKPFVCDICGKSYAQSMKLRTHFLKVHKKPPQES